MRQNVYIPIIPKNNKSVYMYHDSETKQKSKTQLTFNADTLKSLLIKGTSLGCKLQLYFFLHILGSSGTVFSKTNGNSIYDNSHTN